MSIFKIIRLSAFLCGTRGFFVENLVSASACRGGGWGRVRQQLFRTAAFFQSGGWTSPPGGGRGSARTALPPTQPTRYYRPPRPHRPQGPGAKTNPQNASESVGRREIPREPLCPAPYGSKGGKDPEAKPATDPPKNHTTEDTIPINGSLKTLSSLLLSPGGGATVTSRRPFLIENPSRTHLWICSPGSSEKCFQCRGPEIPGSQYWLPCSKARAESAFPSPSHPPLPVIPVAIAGILRRFAAPSTPPSHRLLPNTTVSPTALAAHHPEPRVIGAPGPGPAAPTLRLPGRSLNAD